MASTSTSSAGATRATTAALTFDRARAPDRPRSRAELGLETRFFQTNHEGEFVEHLHRLEGLADGIVLNPGAWTHYS